MAGKEIEKEMVEKVYQAIEGARSTGKIRKGTNEVTKAVEKGNAKLVAIAKDVNPPEIVMHIPLICKEKGIPCVQVGNREELGAAAGLGVATTSVAVMTEGESKALVEEITKAVQE